MPQMLYGLESHIKLMNQILKMSFNQSYSRKDKIQNQTEDQEEHHSVLGDYLLI